MTAAASSAAASVCPSCGAGVAAGRDFCIRCGKAHVEANLACPACHEKSVFRVLEAGRAALECPGCTQAFTALLATARAKTSKGDKRAGTRRYTIRVWQGDAEELLEFTTAVPAGGGDEMEVRSGDRLSVAWVEDHVVSVENLTVDRFYPLQPRASAATIYRSRLWRWVKGG